MIELVEAAVGARLAGDAALAALIGTDEIGEVRVYAGWPAELLDRPAATEFPRVTLFAATSDPIRPESGTVRLQVDVWVWPDGPSGGRARLRAIGERVAELLDERWWIHDGRRFSAVLAGSSGFGSDPGEPLRRMYEFDVLVSPS